MSVFHKKHSFVLLFLTLFSVNVVAQGDTLNSTKKPIKKKERIETFNPRTAIIRSAIIPGWGQITNKKYWKLPIVYGALGTTTYLFFRNLRQFNNAKTAYALAIDGDPTNDDQIKQPYYSVKDQPERIKTFRNDVRQNVDYSVLFFILFWGMNVADAAVDAHLKTFNVSDNLSLQINAGFSPLANTNGINILINLK